MPLLGFNYAFIINFRDDKSNTINIFRFNQQPLTIPKNYVFTGMVGLAVNLIKEWIEQNFQETPAEFEHILYEMTSPIILKGGIFADRAVNSND